MEQRMGKLGVPEEAKGRSQHTARRTGSARGPTLHPDMGGKTKGQLWMEVEWRAC